MALLGAGGGMNEQLPTLPGKVDGVVSWDPLILQCRDCGDTFTGARRSKAADIILSGFHFHTCEGRESHRRCPECLAKVIAECGSKRCAS